MIIQRKPSMLNKKEVLFHLYMTKSLLPKQNNKIIKCLSKLPLCHLNKKSATSTIYKAKEYCFQDCLEYVLKVNRHLFT